jgi:hypothetical protein
MAKKSKPKRANPLIEKALADKGARPPRSGAAWFRRMKYYHPVQWGDMVEMMRQWQAGEHRDSYSNAAILWDENLKPEVIALLGKAKIPTGRSFENTINDVLRFADE